MIRPRTAARLSGLIAGLALSLTALTPGAASAAPANSAVTATTHTRTPLPIWRFWTARINEDKKDTYVAFIDKWYRVKLAAWKEAGLISDYKVLLPEAQGPNDPDIVFMFQYKNAAAMDVPEEVWDQIGDKAVEIFKNDQEIQKIVAAYPTWRVFTGWRPPAKELVGSK